ncbi:protein bunched, class 2/F/G isoform [Anopheles cruzii]|uniref:protein bunched, class 2/F/G isoform n=1 Tax=Anopheles cruzii TaxID=68878 RepID=UPI0022EC3272|nr:protein bunched, class 2/F/G isoform [Anopheles cruzii]
MADNITSIGTSSGSNTTTTTVPVTVQQKGSIGGGAPGGGAGGMHHYHHHHHHPHHHHHNHHKSLEMGGQRGGSKHHTNVIHRTTSESLRLGGGGGGGGGGGVGSSGSSGTGNGDSLMNSVSGGGGGVSGMMGGGGASGNGTTSLGGGENSVSSSSSVNSIGRKGGSSNATGGGGGASGQGAPGTGGKTSSFMITSVTVGASRNSADNGDDSADDLDESHTDDNSRITDFENETPSFSEDTFSKEDVFFGTNAIGSVPVIPTSSQYGLAIVNPNDRAHGGEVLADAMHVSVTEGGLNIMGHGKGDIGDGKELHHRNERFKVVKIESTEPFKRGRWVCMDYLDHTTLQQPAKESGGGPSSQGEGGEAGGPNATQDSGVALTADNPAAGYGSTTADSSLENPNPAAEYHAATAPAPAAGSVATTNSSTVNAALLGMLNNESPGQSLNLPLGGGNGQQMAPPQPSHGQPPGTAAAATSNTTTSGQQQPAGAGGIPHSLPQSQLQNALAGQAVGPGQQSQAPPAAAQYPQQGPPQGQSQYYPHTMTNLADLNLQQSAQAPHQHHQHGATLPSNMQMHPAAAAPPQQSAISAISSSNILPASIPTSQEMNIIIGGNATIQSSFPSPHQQQAFKQQQAQAAASQTNSPVVVVPSSLIDCVPQDATILSPSATTNPPSVVAAAAAIAPDTAGSVSVVEPPSATSSPVTNASSQIIPQSAAAPPSVLDPSVAASSSVSPAATSSSAAAAPANGTTAVAAAAAAVVGSPSTAVAGGSGGGGVSTSSSSTGVGADAAAAAGDPESKLLSAVAGVTAGASSTSSSGEDTDKAATEDGESALLWKPNIAPSETTMSNPPARRITIGGVPSKIISIPRRISLSVAGLPPPQHQQSARALHHQTPQQPQPQQQLPGQQPAALLSKAYSLPPSMGAAAKESLRKDLTQHLFDQQHHPLHSTSHSPLRSSVGGGGGAFSPVVSNSTQSRPQQHAPPGNGGIYTDIALGKSIQNLMNRPPTAPTLAAAVSNRLVAGGSLPRSFGSLGTCRELPEHGEPLAASPPTVGAGGPYCRAATSLLGGFTGSNSVSGCTVTHAHRCVQDLIREELGGGRMGMGGSGGGGGGMAPRLGKAGSMINMMSIDSAADVFSSSGGSQSHPASGRSSPASYLYTGTPIGSPPRIVGSVPGYLLGPATSYGSSPAAGSTRVSRAPSPSFLPTHANSGGDHASASGTGAVAIDNKIEQAMDLVKSHLMFAVREEVEVLKERISELMDRINQLEYENNILKANASQETLSLLTTGGNSVSASSVAAAAQQQQAVTAAVAAAVAATTVAAATAAGTNTKAPAAPPSSANPANGSVS